MPDYIAAEIADVMRYSALQIESLTILMTTIAAILTSLCTVLVFHVCRYQGM